MYKFTLYLMATLYVVAGLYHFINPSMYLPMMPPYLPWPVILIFVSGAFEVVAGLMLFVPRTQKWGAWLVILLLIAVFPANLYMYQTDAAGFSTHFAHWGLLLRLPGQLLLIGWAYVYTRKEKV